MKGRRKRIKSFSQQDQSFKMKQSSFILFRQSVNAVYEDIFFGFLVILFFYKKAYNLFEKVDVVARIKEQILEFLGACCSKDSTGIAVFCALPFVQK